MRRTEWRIGRKDGFGISESVVGSGLEAWTVPIESEGFAGIVGR